MLHQLPATSYQIQTANIHFKRIINASLPGKTDDKGTGVFSCAQGVATRCAEIERKMINQFFLTLNDTRGQFSKRD